MTLKKLAQTDDCRFEFDGKLKNVADVEMNDLNLKVKQMIKLNIFYGFLEVDH